MEQFFGRNQSQNGIPKEFELLVIADPTGFSKRFHLPGVGTVGERLIEQFGARKLVSQYLLQLRNLSRPHASGLLFGRIAVSRAGGRLCRRSPIPPASQLLQTAAFIASCGANGCVLLG